MKVLLEQKDLNKLVATVSRAAATNNVVPALAGMMLEVGGGKFTATALDISMGIRMSTAEIQIEQEGRVLVNASHFTELVRKLPAAVITLELKDNKLVVKYGRSKAQLNTLDSADWVGFPDQGFVEKFVMPQSKLKTALQNTIFATAKNHFRQVFTGVLLDVCPTENEIRFVGSDTHRLAYCRCPVKGLEQTEQFIVPAIAASEAARHLQGEDDVSVGMSGNNIMFCWEGFEMFSRLIDGQYPNYHQVIPSAMISSIQINTASIRECVERINSLPNRKDVPSAVTLEIKDNLTLYGKSESAGEINESCEIVEKQGEDMGATFNAGYLLDGLKAMPEQAKLSFSGVQSPSILQANEDYLVVLVPLRVA